jgi:uncharacterized phage infection (PIP) family protein YhgE
MKTQILLNNKTSFAGVRGLLFLALFMATFSFSATSQSTDKQEAEIVRLRTQVERARLAHDKLEQKVNFADSLITVGDELRESSSNEMKAATNAMKTRKKEYLSQRKSLEKRLKSKSKEDVVEAKAEMKKLDAEFKAETKANDMAMKAEAKKLALGTKNLEKGKTLKKDSEKASKEASKVLTNAQFALEDAIEAADAGAPEEGKKGKKKK